MGIPELPAADVHSLHSGPVPGELRCHLGLLMTSGRQSASCCAYSGGGRGQGGQSRRQVMRKLVFLQQRRQSSGQTELPAGSAQAGVPAVKEGQNLAYGPPSVHNT